MSNSQDNLQDGSQDELVEKKISDLAPFDRKLLVKFVVVDKGEKKEITSRKTQETHNLADVTIGDETGTITLTLWDDTIDQISEGETYVVKNGYVNVFQQHLRLALGKWGKIEESDTKMDSDSVNMDKNRSEEVHEDKRRRQRPFRGGGRKKSFGRREKTDFGEKGNREDFSRY